MWSVEDRAKWTPALTMFAGNNTVCIGDWYTWVRVRPRFGAFEEAFSTMFGVSGRTHTGAARHSWNTRRSKL